MFCQKCKTENPDGAAFCNSCGDSLQTQPVQPGSVLTDKERHNAVIYRRIETKKNERGRNSISGPSLVIILGALIFVWGCLGYFSLILVLSGAVIAGFVLGWMTKRQNDF